MVFTPLRFEKRILGGIQLYTGFWLVCNTHVIKRKLTMMCRLYILVQVIQHVVKPEPGVTLWDKVGLAVSIFQNAAILEVFVLFLISIFFFHTSYCFIF